MALYIPHSIFHLARLLYVRQQTFGPSYYIGGPSSNATKNSWFSWKSMRWRPYVASRACSWWYCDLVCNMTALHSKVFTRVSDRAFVGLPFHGACLRCGRKLAICLIFSSHCVLSFSVCNLKTASLLKLCCVGSRWVNKCGAVAARGTSLWSALFRIVICSCGDIIERIFQHR